MVYLTGVSGPGVRAVAKAVGVGLLVTPANGLGSQVGHFPCWAADNAMFGPRPVTEEKWWRWLPRLPREGCLFASAPDVPEDWPKSWKRSRPWLACIRAEGFPVALVAQDGMTVADLHATSPQWDVLFIGGSTAWKESAVVIDLVREAKGMGRHVHIGRVNSWRRFGHFAAIGADTADGTFLRHGSHPDEMLPKVVAWMERHKSCPPLDL